MKAATKKTRKHKPTKAKIAKIQRSSERKQKSYAASRRAYLAEIDKVDVQTGK